MRGVRLQKLLAWSVVLIIVDQASKIIVTEFLKYSPVVIIPQWLMFYPYHHTNLFIGWVFGVQFPTWSKVLIQLAFIFVMVLGYMYLSYISAKNRVFINGFLIFAVAGVSCAMVDVLIWGGSWDFIALAEMFIMDLKDIYVITCILFAFLYVVFFIPEYLKLSKPERHELDFFLWLKDGCPATRE